VTVEILVSNDADTLPKAVAEDFSCIADYYIKLCAKQKDPSTLSEIRKVSKGPRDKVQESKTQTLEDLFLRTARNR
jgi:hypothetical protein